jgi:hypothetical protein
MPARDNRMTARAMSRPRRRRNRLTAAPRSDEVGRESQGALSGGGACCGRGDVSSVYVRLEKTCNSGLMGDQLAFDLHLDDVGVMSATAKRMEEGPPV